MSLLDRTDDAALNAAPRFMPPKPAERKFSAWGMISAVPRAVGEAAAQGMATVAEVAGAFGQVAGAYPEVIGVTPTPQQRQQADEQRKRLLSQGVDFSSEAGDILRDRGREFRPDPQTASTAEELLYGFARGAAKIVAGAVVAGPAGVVAAGADEALAAADEMKRQGVGEAARTAAGAVQGAGLSLAALPLVGQTLKATAGLYLAGGPGGYVAQQALTREILRNAGHDKVAEQYDPFDPVGLAVASLVPAVFAGVGIRAQRRAAARETLAGPVPSEPTATAAAVREAYAPEVVDAARVAYAVERRAASSKAEPGVRAADTHAEALARAEAAISRGDPVQVVDLVPARVVESLPDFLAREKIKPEPVPPEVTGDFIAFVRASGGIDISQKLDISGERNGVRANPGGIFRKGGRQTDELAFAAEEAGYLRPGESADSGRFVELVQRAIRGERVLTIPEQMQAAARAQHMDSMAARLADVESRLKLLGVDTTPAQGNVAALEAYAAKHEPAILQAALDEARAVDSFSPEFEALRQQARQIAQDIEDGGRSLPQYEAEVRPLSAVMRRLVQEEQRAARTTPAPDTQAATPARGAGAAEPAAPAAEPRAAAAQAPRLNPGETAESAAMGARLQQVAADFPDLLVRMDGDEAPRPLAEFLAAAQREADEMLADAPLMQVAAECAILNGAS